MRWLTSACVQRVLMMCPWVCSECTRRHNLLFCCFSLESMTRFGKQRYYGSSWYCHHLLKLMQQYLHSKYLMLWVYLELYQGSISHARVLVHVQNLQLIIWNSTMDDLHFLLHIRPCINFTQTVELGVVYTMDHKVVPCHIAFFHGHIFIVTFMKFVFF